MKTKLLSALGLVLGLTFAAAPVHASEAESALRSFVEDVRTFSANYEQVQNRSRFQSTVLAGSRQTDATNSKIAH